MEGLSYALDDIERISPLVACLKSGSSIPNVNFNVVDKTIDSSMIGSSNGTLLSNKETPTSSDAMVTPQLSRPSYLKIEKRSSMSQLLSQIKGKLNGKKNKGLKKANQKERLTCETVRWYIDGRWKERWMSVNENQLSIFKDVSLRSLECTLDLSECNVESQTQHDSKEPFVFKLIEKNGKSNSFAAVTEDSYNTLLDVLKVNSINASQPDVSANDISSPEEIDEADSEESIFRDAIVPYSEVDQDSEPYQPSRTLKQTKPASFDSGNDGDVSGFDASDASLIGIHAIAESSKEKMERRRKLGTTEQSLPIKSNEATHENETVHENPVQTVQRRHKKVTYAESSPPTPRDARKSFLNGSANLSAAELRKHDYLDIESSRYLKANRFSVPDFRKRSATDQQTMLRHRSSCLEAVLKLKEAHENNKYPEMLKGLDRNRSTSLYVANRKPSSHVIDENGNHEKPGTWDGLVTSSPIKLSAKTDDSLSNDKSFNSRCVIEGFSEEQQKQQTLLMKRRNSLRLQKDMVRRKVEMLRVSLEENKKQGNRNSSEVKNLTVLQDKLSNINDELENINYKIDVPEDSMQKDTKKTSKKQIFSKFKTTQKSQNAKEKTLSKENMEILLNSPGLSPRVRKRSWSKNIKMLSTSLKRNSESSEPNSNRESMSSVESSLDLQTALRDLAGHNISVVDTSTMTITDDSVISQVPLESDEVDGIASAQGLSEHTISEDALQKIKDFETFAFQLSAKRLPDWIDV